MFRAFIVICLVLLSPLSIASQKASILIVGDSISAEYGIESQSGWANLLASKITQEKLPYQVINASISGDTTISGLNRLKPLLEKYQPAVIILELGGNDGLRGLPVKVMKNNLHKMIEMSKRHQSKVLLAGMKIPPNYGKRYTDAFYKVYQDLSKTHKTRLIPFLLEGIGDKPELMQSDGIHPTQAAQPLIMNSVWEKLQPLL